jgi:hypothetical protein
MWVLEPGDCLRLRPEPSKFLRPGVGARQDHLQGDQPLEPDLAGAVDDAHAAPAQDAEDRVAGEGRQRGCGRRGGRRGVRFRRRLVGDRGGERRGGGHGCRRFRPEFLDAGRPHPFPGAGRQDQVGGLKLPVGRQGLQPFQGQRAHLAAVPGVVPPARVGHGGAASRAAVGMRLVLGWAHRCFGRFRRLGSWDERVQPTAAPRRVQGKIGRGRFLECGDESHGLEESGMNAKGGSE